MAPPACPAPLFPAASGCGTDGACLSDMLCACPPGFTGAGDFVLGQPTCIVNVQAVAALWSITCAAWLVNGVYAMYCLNHLLKQPPKNNFKRKVFFALFIIAGAVCFAYVGVMRAMNPVTTAIGTNAGVTVAFAIGVCTFWLGSLLFTYSFIFVLVRQSKVKGSEYLSKVKRLQVQLNIIYPIFAVLIILVGGMCPLLMLKLDPTDPNQRWNMYGLTLAHYVGLSSCIGGLGLVIVPGLLKPVIHDLREMATVREGPESPKIVSSGANEQIRIVLSKFDKFLVNLKRDSILNLVLALLMGLWPFLQLASSYFLPIAWTSSIIVVLNALHTNLPVRSGQNSQGDESVPPFPQINEPSSSAGGSTVQSVVVLGNFRESQKVVVTQLPKAGEDV